MLLLPYTTSNDNVNKVNFKISSEDPGANFFFSQIEIPDRPRAKCRVWSNLAGRSIIINDT